MPLINLIQEQRISEKRGDSKARLYFVSFVTSAALGLGAIGFLVFKTEATHGDISQLEANIQKLQPMIGQIESARADYGVIAPRVETLQAARDLTDKWNRVLDHLTVQTPDKVWLTAIRATGNDPKAPISVTFTGLAHSQELIGEFQLRLQGCEDLESVNFKYSQEKPVANSHLIEFQIESGLVGTQQEKEKNEGKEEK